MTVTDTPPQAPADEPTPTRGARAMAYLRTDPLAGISKTFRILFFFALALTLLVIYIRFQPSPAPVVQITNGQTDVRPVDTGTTTAAAVTAPNPLVALAESQNRVIHPTLGRILQDPTVCDSEGVCGYPNWPESNAIYGQILAGPQGDLCDLRVEMAGDGTVSTSYGPDYTAGMVPVLNCDEPVDPAAEPAVEIVIEENGRLPGLTAEELEGE